MGVSDSGGDIVYRESVEPVLVSLSNLYSDDDEISVSNSRYSSYPAYTNTLEHLYLLYNHHLLQDIYFGI